MTFTDDYARGFAYAQRDLIHCDTHDDVSWFLQAAKGNLTGAALVGYADGMTQVTP
jgi:hypothetical protein